MSASIRFLLVLCCITALSEAFRCKIVVRVTSRTTKKFKAEIAVPALGIKSEPMVFEGETTKKMKVIGEECGKKPWVIRTYKWKNNEWKLAHRITAKLQGQGWIRIVVNDDLKPSPLDRFGVMCSEGICG
ncbi:hypothetical protein RB195_025736 [Necator americanus]|uniref:Transthyretin-like family protein n=1 Tax=Necator americanus TaxID=51031 RepID=A0ABR1EU89_NECAM